MYENLTRLIDALENDTYGEVIIDTKSKGTIDDPIHMPYASYTEVVGQLWNAIYDFSNEHPEFELTKYQDILRRNGADWVSEDMSGADVSSADGQFVMALLMGATRAERFCEGALLGFCEDGSILRWLKRLKDVDTAEELSMLEKTISSADKKHAVFKESLHSLKTEDDDE